MTAFELQAQLAKTGEQRSRTERAVAANFDEAVRKYRRRAAPEEVRLALMPVAAELLRAMEDWLPAKDEGTVRIEGHLEGGKLENKFTLYRCAGRPPKTTWKKRDEWSIEFADERDEHVAEVELPLRRELSGELLVVQLAAFVAKVDVPEADGRP
jgi:hypothetical protein